MNQETVSQSTKSRIIDAALNLVLENGNTAITISAVCEQSGISRTTVYRCFNNASDIVEAVFTEVRDRYERGLRAAIARDPAPENRLDVVTDYMARHAVSGITEKIARCSHELIDRLAGSIHESRQQLYTEVLAPYLNMFARMKNSPVDIPFIAHTLVYYYAGLVKTRDGSSAEEIKTRLKRLITGLSMV
ncbi:MAG: TetR/AcrR family transcriptional regulator [Porticoccaceae bacterium]